MRITRLSIQNFRSIEELSFNVPQVCALIGPNNAGKSNILEALRRVLGTNWVTVSSFSPDDVFMRDSERAVTITCRIDPPISYRRFKSAPSTHIHGISFRNWGGGSDRANWLIYQYEIDIKGVVWELRSRFLTVKRAF